MSFIYSLLSSVIVSNVILVGTKGLCSYIGISKNRKASVGMGFAMTFVCIIAGLICWGLNIALAKLDATFMATIVDILVIASLVQILELFIKRFIPSLYASLGIYLPLITTNCVVLGLCLSLSTDVTQWASVLGTIIGTPLGFFLVIFVFSLIQERIQSTPEVPNGFKGAAIAFLATAGMALAFSGFAGMFA